MRWVCDVENMSNSTTKLDSIIGASLKHNEFDEIYKLHMNEQSYDLEI